MTSDRRQAPGLSPRTTAGKRAATGKRAAPAKRSAGNSHGADKSVVPVQTPSQDSTGSSVAVRALALLAELARHPGGLTLQAITQRLDWPKPTVHRLCRQLEDAGWILRTPAERLLTLGPAALQFGLAALRHDAANAERHTILRALVERIGETCNFTMLAGAEVFYIDRVESAWPLRLHLEPGSRVPLHCTASGKLFLSEMPAEQRRRVLSARPLAAATPNTLTALPAIEREMRVIQQRGYSLDREEFLLGLIAIAVPVRDAEQRLLAALAVHAPLGRMTVKRALSLLPVLQQAAAALGRTLQRNDA